MNRYDDIVVGSGISGLTMTLLLAMNGHKVLLLEKSPRIGGSLCRFRLGQTDFDTGFHFTGGMNDGGILTDILGMLRMREMIEPVFIQDSRENRFIFESAGRSFEHPVGFDNVRNKFKEYFPAEASAVDAYFAAVQSVCQRTPSLNIRDNLIAPPNLEEDYVSLDEVLKRMTGDPLLRGLLSGYAMCYGVRPDEVSFANHCRMVQNFYESIAFVRDGGDAFIRAFKKKFKEYDVEVRCSTTIAELTEVRDSRVNRFILTSGEEVGAYSCVFTIHPRDVLELLPQKSYSRAFASRVGGFDSSAGFFSVFARLKPGVTDRSSGSIVSLFPDADVNNLLDPAWQGTPALVIINSADAPDAEGRKGICILEPSFAGQVEPWRESRLGGRPEGYVAYKQQRVEAIREHLFSVLPHYRENLEIVGAGSMLTYRDYLHSPDGSAYGVKQKMRQFNVIGKLPLHNLYAAGQSALLPGIIGAMMSSLIVGRSVMGKDEYGKLLGRVA
jgi:phytoene dehydrogenase-like protein